jgi:mannose-6-phosphate isomerase
MAIELARTQVLPRSWGVVDLRPWNKSDNTGIAVREIWCERRGRPLSSPALLFKLLLTSQPLSIQVHPNDAYAQSIGLPNGKTEPCYVLSAIPGAKVALGLRGQLTQPQLRDAISDGSILGRVVWQGVSAHDVIFVPAGTIHAIGAGLVIAEIQQRSNAPFRLFDYGRGCELHIDSAIAVASTGPAHFQVRPNQLYGPHFVLERIDLAPNSTLCLEAKRETWLLVLSGGGVAGSLAVAAADAVFAQSENVDIHAGKLGMVGRAAYAGVGPVPHLLPRLTQPGSAQLREP